MKLITTYRFQPSALSRLQEEGYQVSVLPSEQALLESEEAADADVIVANHRTLQVDFLEKCKRLKWAQVPHAGIERLDMNYMKRRGIIVINARGGFGTPISEDILAKMLMLSRNSLKYARNQFDRRWEGIKGTINLYGKTVGIVGTGDVGQQTAWRAKSFGMTTVGVNTTGNSVIGFDRIYTRDRLNELISESDFVVLACPLTEQTRSIIGEEQLQRMKPSAFLINISRGALIDETLLLHYLQNKKIAGAALDVFVEEFKLGRLPETSPFWDLDNVIITPHQAGAGDQFDARFTEVFLENARHFIRGEWDRMVNVRDYGKGY